MWPVIRLFSIVTAMTMLAGCAGRRQPVPAPLPAAEAVNFTVPGVDDVPDLHGNPANPDLVVFFGGNEFMVLPELLAAFRSEYPAYRRIFCETLPPGILARQIQVGMLRVGNLELEVRPDVVTGGKERLEKMKKAGQVTRTTAYAGNRLAIMVREGNPKSITSLRDLQRRDVSVAMPDRSIEDIGKKIEEAYIKAGGPDLAEAVLERKPKDGTTWLTTIHHRQTPLRIIQRESDAGPVWATEVTFQQSLGQPIAGVTIRKEENVEATSVAGVMADAPRPQAAQDFLTFIAGDRAKEVYRKYGFLPPP